MSLGWGNTVKHKDVGSGMSRCSLVWDKSAVVGTSLMHPSTSAPRMLFLLLEVGRGIERKAVREAGLISRAQDSDGPSSVTC